MKTLLFVTLLATSIHASASGLNVKILKQTGASIITLDVQHPETSKQGQLIYHSHAIHQGQLGFGWCSPLDHLSNCENGTELSKRYGSLSLLNATLINNYLVWVEWKDGLLTAVHSPKGVYRFQYNDLKNLTEIKKEDHAYRIQYNDDLDQVQYMIRPDQCREDYVYKTKLKQTLMKLKCKNRTHYFVFDEKSRLAQVRSTTGPNLNLKYSSTDQLTTVESQARRPGSLSPTPTGQLKSTLRSLLTPEL